MARGNFSVGGRHVALATAYSENVGGTPVTITVTTAGTYYDLTNGSILTASGATIGSGNITVGAAGTYFIMAQVSFGGTNSATIDGAIHNGGTITNIQFSRKLGTGGDVGSASCSGILELAASDSIDLRFTSDGNGDTVDVYAHQLTVFCIEDSSII